MHRSTPADEEPQRHAPQVASGQSKLVSRRSTRPATREIQTWASGTTTSGAQRSDRWVVDGKKPGGRFVEHMQRKGHGKCKPGTPKARCRLGPSLMHGVHLRGYYLPASGQKHGPAKNPSSPLHLRAPSMVINVTNASPRS